MSIIVLQAPSRLMNPTLDQSMIDAELEADREAASSEWLGEFRSSTTQFLDDELIEAAIAAGVRECPFTAGHRYHAFVDPSGGRHDDMTLSIAHSEGERLVQDHLSIVSPPFVPGEVVETFCQRLTEYGIASVTGDRYSGEWVSSEFARHGVGYISSALDKSAILMEVLPPFAERRVQILDINPQETQFRLLERRPRPGGKGDIVDHPRNSKDDAANACAGSLWLAAQENADAPDAVYPRDWLKQAQARWESNPPPGIPMCALGVGLRGTRSPVLAYRHDGWFGPLVALPDMQSGPDLAAAIVKHRQHMAMPVIDVSESLGERTFGHLRDQGFEVFGFKPNAEAREKTVERQLGFANLRSAAYWRFREALDPSVYQGSPICLPNDPELVAQLEAVRYRDTSSGITVSTKEELEKVLRRPADRADAVVLCWYRGARAMTHFAEWRADQYPTGQGGFNRGRLPKVNYGPRRRGGSYRR